MFASLELAQVCFENMADCLHPMNWHKTLFSQVCVRKEHVYDFATFMF